MSTKSTTGPKPECEISAIPEARDFRTASGCPSPEAVLSLVSGRALRPADFPVLRHLARCPACQSSLAFTAEAVERIPSASRSAGAAVWTETAARRLARHLAFWQRCIDREADAIAAGIGNEGRLLLFRSTVDARPDRAWKAELVFSRDDGQPAAFTLHMLPYQGHTASEGHFVLFGASTPVAGGTATLPPDILSKASNAGVSGEIAFVAPDGVATPGFPVFDIPD